MQKPTVGRIVHYYMRDSGNEAPKPCAAIITAVHSDTRVRLCAFDPFTLRFVEHAEEPTPGCWSWPPWGQ